MLRLFNPQKYYVIGLKSHCECAFCSWLITTQAAADAAGFWQLVVQGSPVRISSGGAPIRVPFNVTPTHSGTVVDSI